MRGTLLDALHALSNSEGGVSQHRCSNQCFLLTWTTEGDLDLNVTHQFTRWLTQSSTHRRMDMTGRKYGKTWKICHRRHKGSQQCNQTMLSELLCALTVCQGLGPTEKDNSAPESMNTHPRRHTMFYGTGRLFFSFLSPFSST